MLVELTITDLAIIRQTTVRFTDGLNALTGETGAGKSILLDALGAVLGARVSSDLVRTGASVARVEAAFEVPPSTADRVHELLTEIGVEHDPDDLLVLSRDIQATGRSSGRINGRMTTAAQLAAVGALLVDIHGQSDHLAILRADEQRTIVDRYGHLEPLRDALPPLVAEERKRRRQLADLDSGSRERAQRLDLLTYQITEIDEAGLVPGEDDALSQERDRLQNADALRRSAFTAIHAIAGDDTEFAALNALRIAHQAVTDLAGTDAAAQPFSERATEIVVLAEDLVRDLQEYAEGIDGDPARLQEVEDRLDLIHTLKRKYGATIDDVLAYLARIRAECDQLTSGLYDRESLEAELRRLQNDLAARASHLSRARQETATRLAEIIAESIASLRMGKAAVEIQVRQRSAADGLPLADGRRVTVDETGIDDVSFLIAPNAGEALKPFGKIASGGETARIMLAVKSILSDVDQTPTLVFDEIDVGVGGRSGQLVGEKLWSLTDRHQVIVISHLAQIAAFADQHLRISKVEEDGRVVSHVEELTPLTREEELAAMLDGVPATPESRANARAMLDRVHAFRTSRQAASG